MKINHCLVLLTLIFSFSNCILYSEEEIKDIQSYTPTKFSIGNGTNCVFKYKLDKKNKIGLGFLEANTYTINVTTYSSYEQKENKITRKIAESQFFEIDVSGYGDFLYITFDFSTVDYFYDDYLTIYDSEVPMILEHNKVFSFNNFLSTHNYKFEYNPEIDKKIILFYNTKNYENNNRTISIKLNDGSENVVDKDAYSHTYEIKATESLKITVTSEFIESTTNMNQKQEFTIMIREIEDLEYDFNKIDVNKIEKINYIQSNESQTFYFYANITGLKYLNTLNFKLDYKYFGKNMINVLSKIISLEREIQQDDLKNNLPNTNESYANYDMYSDEYFRIYINNSDIPENKYSYILASVQIQNESYYYGSKSLEISIGEPEEIFNYTNIEYNKHQTIEKQTLAYIPYYCKLMLNKDDVYLLTTNTDNHFVATFINGDLIINNSNILEKNNEVIVLLDREELTIKLFGIKKNVIFYVERVKKDEIEFREDTRKKNDIITLNMKQGQIKHVLGTYSYDDYAYGKLNEFYYATSDSGSFEILYNHNYTNDQESLFPEGKNYEESLNEIINLDTHLDFFTINCTSDGVLSIRPQYKKFDYTVRLIGENNYSLVTMSEPIEVAQLSAPLGKRNEMLYFTIMLINSENLLTFNNEAGLTLKISPDTPGAFESGTIKENEIFKGKIDLGKYKLDELGVLLNSTDFGTELEIVEVIHNKYTSYSKLNEGNNEVNESYNVYIPITPDIENINITLQKLNGKSISYGIIKSAIDDINYITTADKYIDTTSAQIGNEMYNFSVNNDYYKKNDTIKKYTYFILSVLGKEDNLKYNLDINFTRSSEQPTDGPQPSNNDKTKIVIIVVIIVVVVLILVGIILFNVISRKRRSSSEIEKLSSIDSTENQLT